MDEDQICWACNGRGMWHDCGEDTCCCLDPEPDQFCDECYGDGYINRFDHLRDNRTRLGD